MKKIDVKKLIILYLPFVLFFYLADKAGQAFRLAYGADISAKVLNIGGGFAAAFQNPLPSFHPQRFKIPCRAFTRRIYLSAQSARLSSFLPCR